MNAENDAVTITASQAARLLLVWPGRSVTIAVRGRTIVATATEGKRGASASDAICMKTGAWATPIVLPGPLATAFGAVCETACDEPVVIVADIARRYASCWVGGVQVVGRLAKTEAGSPQQETHNE